MTEKVYFEKVAIIGVGLIGGSLAMVMRQKNLCAKIMGIGRTRENLQLAKKLGIVDAYTTDALEVISEADLVVIAAPVLKTVQILSKISKLLKKGAIVMDVGSVKLPIIEAGEAAMPEGVYFVGTHPIAGTEKSGAGAAFPELFINHKCIITPTEDTNREALDKIKRLWQETGAEVITMDAEVHDWVLSATSHLPHIIAFTLVNTVANTIVDAGSRKLDMTSYSAGGFRDITRIASSSPEMWGEICGANRKYVAEVLETFQKRLDVIKKMVVSNDASGLAKDFERAKKFRDSLPDTKKEAAEHVHSAACGHGHQEEQGHIHSEACAHGHQEQKEHVHTDACKHDHVDEDDGYIRRTKGQANVSDHEQLEKFRKENEKKSK